jgi:translation initiation factor 2 subunit 2
MEYDAMLERAKKLLPQDIEASDRFAIPKIKGHIEGNKTVVSNFFQIADTLGRKPEHLLKYVLKELATPGEIKKNLVIFGSKVSASRLNEKIQRYAEDFVICKECGRPDTKLLKEDDFFFIKCQACGAKQSIAARI